MLKRHMYFTKWRRMLNKNREQSRGILGGSTKYYSVSYIAQQKKDKERRWLLPVNTLVRQNPDKEWC